MQRLNKKTVILISIVIVIIIGIYYFFTRDKEYIEEGNFNILQNTENNGIKDDSTVDTENKGKIVVYVAGAVNNEGIYELNENSRIADSIEKAGGLTDDADISNINLAYVLEDGLKVYIPRKGENNNEIKDDTTSYVSKESGDTESSQTVSSSTKSTGNTGSTNGTNSNNQNSKININTATQTELETLPGIGPSTAMKIINYRKENGKFTSIEDIKKVSGIGDAKYAQIKDLIKI